ncbi:putative membrane protein [Brucella inopinata]|nr:putative membrane protein [Brucella inopinata]
MPWFVKHWRVLAAIGACLAGLGLYALGRHDGTQQAAVAAAEATARAIQKRADVDEKIIDMDSYQLCI